MSEKAKPKTCPMCRKPRSAEFSPFCSARCRDKDLAQWFNDGYALPGPPALPDDIAKEE